MSITLFTAYRTARTRRHLLKDITDFEGDGITKIIRSREHNSYDIIIIIIIIVI